MAKQPKLPDMEVQKEIQKAQEKILRAYKKRLTQKDLINLNQFVSSGLAPGSKEFQKLRPALKEVIIKLNVSGLEIMQKATKNPFQKLRYAIAKSATRKIPVMDKKKKTKTKKKKK
jgi:hypothetical protein